MKNYDQKLKLLSLINEKILNRSTEERYRLMHAAPSKQKKRWMIPTVALSLAAVLLLSVVTVLLIPLLTKQIPVYTGMTVSNKLPLERAYADDVRAYPIAAKGDYDGDYVGGKKPSKNPNLDKTVQQTLLVEGSSESLYYAKPNEDIYITIHIDNPNQYEILSFTLNGKKYSSYMLEDGSDMENLILKVNVGNVEGIVEYTIDAIKYVDGTEIKDVKMEGDKTVRIGVQPEKSVSVKLENEIVDCNVISFTATISDPKKLIELFNGKAEAALYTGGELVATKELSLSESTKVVFDGLLAGAEYQYAIVAHYDALDGKGFGAYILEQKAVCTPTELLFDGIEITQTEISFALVWNKKVTSGERSSLCLYRGEEKLRDLALDTTKISDLLSGAEYRLVAEYNVFGEAKSITLTFTTAAKTAPIVSIENVTRPEYFKTAEFDVKVQDVDQIVNIQEIALYQGETLVATGDYSSHVVFKELDPSVVYTVKILYSYDLNDGSGVQTENITKDLGKKVDVEFNYDNDGDGQKDIYSFWQYSPVDFTKDNVVKINMAGYTADSVGVTTATLNGWQQWYIDYNDTTINNSDKLIKWEFEVPEAGYYEFFFQLRVKSETLVRGNMVSIDGGEPYCIEYALDEGVKDAWKNDIDNSYVTGFGVELSAGKHTITVKYDPLAEKSLLFRNIYLIKAS